jgi:uncharacterized membrane protein
VNVKNKLEEWQSAGILPADVAARILLHEEQRHRQRPYLLYALGGLGALAVGTGIVSLVASNWDAIPPGAKLGLDVLLVAALSAGIARADARRAAWVRETLLVLQYGVVLASIGLIAQIYHLGGAPYEALLAWTALTAFLMSRGRTPVVAAIWVIGLQVTYGAVLAEIGDRRDLELFAAGLAYLAPLACLGIADAPAVARSRPHLAGVLRAFAWGEIALAGSLGPLRFYADREREEGTGLLHAGFALAVIATAVVAARVGPRGPGAGGARRGVQLVLGAALLAAFVPFLLPHGEWPVAAALSFIGFWAAVGWAGHGLRRFQVLNAATAMIGLRILIAYFEVFGSLLSTGLGLITGGLLTLGLAWAWLRKSRDFKRRLAPEPGEGAGREGDGDG